MEMKTEDFHAEMESRGPTDNGKLEHTFNINISRNKVQLPSDDTHITCIISWLKDEFESFKIICQDFQPKLNGIMKALEYEQKPRLEESQFNHTKRLRNYDGKEDEMGKVKEDFEINHQVVSGPCIFHYKDIVIYEQLWRIDY